MHIWPANSPPLNPRDVRRWHFAKEQIYRGDEFPHDALPQLQDSILKVMGMVAPELVKKATDGFRARAEWVAENDGNS